MICPACRYKEEFSSVYAATAPAEAFESEYSITAHESTLHGNIFRCENCSHCFVYPLPTPETLKRFYETCTDHEYEREQKNRLKTARTLLDKITTVKKNGSLLEIGCATGIFLSLASKKFDAEGIEPSTWSYTQARKKGLSVRNAFFESVLFEKTYDVIVMNDVIEHLENPLETIEKCRKLLNETGVIVLVTPDFSSLMHKILKERWWGINLAHIQYFDKHSISEFLKSTGFEPIHFSYYTRFFSVKYICSKFRFLEKPANFLSSLPFIKSFFKIPIRLNFRDQMVVIAGKCE